jgi:hypothetical protein
MQKNPNKTVASPIEIFFENIFGYLPSKRGAAYERLAAIALHLFAGGNVKHDVRLRGAFSQSLYQLDILHATGNSKTVGEAKDFSLGDGKVGRGDLQKLGGALPELKGIDKGVVFSATGYTSPAKRYAGHAENISGKPISLFELRPSTERDEQRFIKTLVIRITAIIPLLDQAKWLPHLTTEGSTRLASLQKSDEDSVKFQVDLYCFCDAQGNEILSLRDLTSRGYGDINRDTNKSHGCFLLENHFIDVEGVLVEINGLEYEVPYSYDTSEIIITDDSEHPLALKNGEGKVLKILTDKKLREYSFDEDGNLKKD